ncbi:MAG: gliding motility-associated C-terminal domain-containing protein [Cytophagales bacterium]|nr:MAG: gliding motility-associated C-terminal domain-containing protein [Cytophagales bacterium]
MKLISCFKITILPFFSKYILFLVLVLFYSENYAQCPANPPNCVPNNIPSNLKDTLYFCEGVNQVNLDSEIPNVSGGVNISWFKLNASTNTWIDINDASVGFTINTAPASPEKYAVCWRQPNTGCYKSDTVVIASKNFSDQLNREKEFDLPSDAKFVLLCEGIPQRPFGDNASLGNPKYSYRWEPGSIDNLDIKNPLIRVNLLRRTTVAEYPRKLTIEDKLYKCSVGKVIDIKTYPPIVSEFINIKSNYCENNNDSIEVRLFLLNGYTVSNAQFQIASNSSSNFDELDFKKIPSNKALPNKFGNQTKIDEFRELNDPNSFVHTLKVPVVFPTDGDIQIKFNIENNIGCKADEITTTVKVQPTDPYTITLDPSGKTNFCINDNRVGPLTSSPAGSGTFSGKGISGDNTNGYFFDPKVAGAGNHVISFTLNANTPGACAGGGSITATVRPAPKPKLIGKANVCPGSANVEYKDTAFFQNTSITKTWRIENSSNVTISSVTSSTFGTNGDSIRLTFPDPYSQPNNIAKLIRLNDDAGCIASDTIEIKVNPLEKSPAPSGPKTGCLGGSTVLSYTKGTSSSTGFTYRWKVTQGTKVAAVSDSSKVDINWNTTSPVGSRTITVTDVSIKSDGTECRIESDPLVVNFINPPIATIKNPIGQAVCAGDTVLVEEANPITGVTYTWTPGNISGPSAQIIVPNPSSNFLAYTLTAELPNTSCQKSTDNENLVVKATPDDPLPEDIIENCFDDDPIVPITVVFSNTSPPPAPGPGAEWINPLDANNSDPNQTKWLASKAGIYSVTVTDGLTGCKNSGSLEILDVCPAKFFVPAAFSPNNDKFNDSLKIFGKRFLSFDFKIFNRWGEVIFSTKDPSIQWDGNNGGQEAPNGVYPYVCVFESLNDKNRKISTTKEGSITLIR